MEKTVGEVARLANISVRTLRYYDRIGLLKPDGETQAGYRLYGEAALERLWQILFFRELDFPLEEIQRILDAPGYDRREALKGQRELLRRKRERLDGLIQLIEENLKGEKSMRFEEFDDQEIVRLREEYAREARERWGTTEAYRQSQSRAGGYSRADRACIQQEADAIFREFASLRGRPPREARGAVEKWRGHITRFYYDCTPEILHRLAQMYVDDPRFRENLDAFGEGTAQCMRDAILDAYT